MELSYKARAAFREHVMKRADDVIGTRPELAQSLLFLEGQLERVGAASDDCIAGLGAFLDPDIAEEARGILREIRGVVQAKLRR